MATYPDYTPKPQPNFSTKPVEAPVMPAGKLVPSADTRDRVEEAAGVVSQHGGHSTTEPNKLAARTKQRHAQEVLPQQAEESETVVQAEEIAPPPPPPKPAREVPAPVEEASRDSRASGVLGRKRKKMTDV